VSQSQIFSPIANIKSRRYEDIETIYDNIVEQEELRRLKREKIIAKKRQQKKKLLMSKIEDPNQTAFDDSDNNSS
jgi:hypothetical protein